MFYKNKSCGFSFEGPKWELTICELQSLSNWHDENFNSNVGKQGHALKYYTLAVVIRHRPDNNICVLVTPTFDCACLIFAYVTNVASNKPSFSCQFLNLKWLRLTYLVVNI